MMRQTQAAIDQASNVWSLNPGVVYVPGAVVSTEHNYLSTGRIVSHSQV